MSAWFPSGVMVHSSDLEPEELRRVLADHVARDEARAFRRFFLARLALVAAGVWLLSWPIHLLPHTALWSLVAAAVLGIGLMSPSRHRAATRDMPPKPPRRAR
jgi:hypothetical protein